ncbi:class I SAM-dependent methyltransferase [Mesorhizobium opportunistum]|uniref:Class I SAM-dependent methyltransferase n=1 Tax=Mesorhizobium opportunistum TaxID=593909 RepID=A0ABV1YBJ1_9HYPH|nr:class I SAM-dependent methyltransferase [Mesorhizobium sp.]TIN90732.1 MAG: class I SAM-dependent methyltransferase [Mesorhizobium sp.]TJU97912.1 MAG: class I SAM-dependent methyltransferase [Mesorhizobium sp.]TJV16279.1 MAG: class I SAM-dependent methyltransferase [Mesorhizobium sp.]
MNNASNLEQITSTGHKLSAGRHLDIHYLALKDEYDATLRAAGIQPGWSVLDAGAGNGVFLPLMAEMLGVEGHIEALDLARENVEAIESLVASQQFACPISARTGDITKLPYETGTFDAVWSANVSQYLSDEVLAQTIKEFCRVVKPGGLIAVKEVDISVWQFQPLDPKLTWRLLDALSGDTQISGAMRATRLSAWFRAAGLENVSAVTTLAERRQPLRPVEREYIRNNLEFLSGLSRSCDLPEADHQQWNAIGKDPERLISNPDFCYREMWVLSLGIVPKC